MKKQLLERLFFGVFISLLLVLMSTSFVSALAFTQDVANTSFSATVAVSTLVFNNTPTNGAWTKASDVVLVNITVNVSSTTKYNLTGFNITVPSGFTIANLSPTGSYNATAYIGTSAQTADPIGYTCINDSSAAQIISCVTNYSAGGGIIIQNKSFWYDFEVKAKAFTDEVLNETFVINISSKGNATTSSNYTVATGVDGLAPQVTAVSLTDGQNVRPATGSTNNLTKGLYYVKNTSLTISATISESGAGINSAMVCFTTNGSQPRVQCPHNSGLGVTMTNTSATAFSATIQVSNLTGSPAWLGAVNNQLSFVIIVNDSSSTSSNASNINLSKNSDGLPFNVTIQQGTLNWIQPTDATTNLTWTYTNVGAHAAQSNDTIILNITMNVSAFNMSKKYKLGNATYLKAWYAIVNATGANTITWNSMTNNTETILSGNMTWGALFNSTSVNDGAHVIMFNVTDGAYWNTTNITNVTFDNTAPTASISLSKTSMTTAESTTVTCGGSDGSYGSDGYCDIAGRGCSPFNYTIDVQVPGEAQYTSISTGPATTSASYTPTTAGTFTARCQVNDYQGTGSTTSTFSVTFSTTGTTGGGPSSSSSGTGTTTTTIPAAATSSIGTISTAGANAVMAANSAATFTVPVTTGTTQAHSAKIKSIGTNEVTVTISSTPQDVTIKVNETKQVDLDGDNKADLEVKLNKITTDNRADLTFKAIKAAEAVTPTTTTTPTTGAAKPAASKSAIWITVIVILVILIIGYFVLKKKK